MICVHRDHVERNREYWDGLTGVEGEYARQVEYGRRQWTAQPNWGDWSIPESELRLLPADLSGRRAIELGCGTAYVSAWLARRGASPVGIDASRRQLAFARQMQRENGLAFPLVLADAEMAPCPDASFDLALSEYGASSWCDPDRWLAEAARLLRPGGILIFLTTTPLLMVCMPDDGRPAGERLLHDYFGMRERRWQHNGSVEFQLPYGEWIRLLRRVGFDIEDLSEIRAPRTASSPWPYVDRHWARRWPSEQVWTVRKRR